MAARQWANLPPQMKMDLPEWSIATQASGEPYLREETAEAFFSAKSLLNACNERRRFSSGFTLVPRHLPGYGVGKTTLVVALARSLVQLGVRVHFESLPRLFGRISEARHEGTLEWEYSRLAQVPVLILDDLGREKPTPTWVDHILWPLIDDRESAGRPIIATTNYTWVSLQARYESARSEFDQSNSGGSLVDRLQRKAPAILFGGRDSHREPVMDFLPGETRL